MSVNTVKITVGGVTYNAVYNDDGGYWLCQATAPAASSAGEAGGYYPLTLWADADSMNPAFRTVSLNDADPWVGKRLRLDVYETAPPVISGLTPSDGSTAEADSDIAFVVSDNDSGIADNGITLSLDGVAVSADDIVKTATDNGYACLYSPVSPLSPGVHTLSAVVSDRDGNSATASWRFIVPSSRFHALLALLCDRVKAVINTFGGFDRVEKDLVSAEIQANTESFTAPDAVVCGLASDSCAAISRGERSVR